MTMKVWIDHEHCTGDGLCADICPQVFFMHDDGTTYRGYVHSTSGVADVPPALEGAVAEAVGDCPGECIHLEAEVTAPRRW